MDHLTEGFKKCPACNGEGFPKISTVHESGIPGTESHLVIMDAEECEVCDGTGEVPEQRS